MCDAGWKYCHCFSCLHDCRSMQQDETLSPVSMSDRNESYSPPCSKWVAWRRNKLLSVMPLRFWHCLLLQHDLAKPDWCYVSCAGFSILTSRLDVRVREPEIRSRIATFSLYDLGQISELLCAYFPHLENGDNNGNHFTEFLWGLN